MDINEDINRKIALVVRMLCYETPVWEVLNRGKMKLVGELQEAKLMEAPNHMIWMIWNNGGEVGFGKVNGNDDELFIINGRYNALTIAYYVKCFLNGEEIDWNHRETDSLEQQMIDIVGNPLPCEEVDYIKKLESEKKNLKEENDQYRIKSMKHRDNLVQLYDRIEKLEKENQQFQSVYNVAYEGEGKR